MWLDPYPHMGRPSAARLRWRKDKRSLHHRIGEGVIAKKLLPFSKRELLGRGLCLEVATLINNKYK